MAGSYTFVDLSGTAASSSGNPYDGLIEACQNQAAQIQSKYGQHRDTRADQQKAKLLSPDFQSVTVDDTLLKLETVPGFADTRKCLVFWARPPPAVRALIKDVQQRLIQVVPRLWIMPEPSLHMTALEIAHSLTDAEIDELVHQLNGVAKTLVDYPFEHRARLIKPKITYDAQAMALSYLPASGECLQDGRTAEDDNYTYHHLRRDLHAICSDAGVKVGSRYVVPSAHLTIARFIFADDFKTEGRFDSERMKKLIDVIEETNAWLEKNFWPRDGEAASDGSEWVVGEGHGLDHRKGSLWYGGGETICIGRGF